MCLFPTLNQKALQKRLNKIASKKYPTAKYYWTLFCKELEYDVESISERKLSLFAEWLTLEYQKTGGVVSDMIKNVISWKNMNFKGIRRLNFETLKKIVDNIKKENPSKERRIRPITATILKLMLSQLKNSWEDLNRRAALTAAYSHLLRSGEYTTTGAIYRERPLKRLNWEDFSIDNDKHSKQTLLEIKVWDTKMKPGPQFEQTLSECTCKSFGFCALHSYLELKDAKLKRDGYIDLTGPIFVNKFGGWITPTSMNRTIKRLADLAGLDKSFYFAHGCRSGCATDMKQAGNSDFVIQKEGRWGSDVWKRHYLKLDMYDVRRMKNDEIAAIHSPNDNGYSTSSQRKFLGRK